jgi:hypothetical protein
MYNFPSIRKTGDDGSTGLKSRRIQQRPIYQVKAQTTMVDFVTLALTLAAVTGRKNSEVTPSPAMTSNQCITVKNTVG